MFYYCIVFAIVIQSNFVVVPSPKSMMWLGHLSQIIEWLGHLIVPNKSIFFFGGGRCGRNGSNQGFRPKIRPKTRFFGGHKYGLSHFRVAWDAKF